MTIKCKIGLHTWNGCKCSVCKKSRDSEHDWTKDCEKCSQCGKTREFFHDYTKDCLVCAKCGKYSRYRHEWNVNVCINCSVEKPKIEWVNIPAGTFLMGSPISERGREDIETQHEVTLNSFKMSKYAVTFEQYDFFCEDIRKLKPNDNGLGRGSRPVINLSWYDAKLFADWMGCRLPTEAEWEYACRAGTTTRFNTGETLSASQANYNSNYQEYTIPNAEFTRKLLPVGSFAPNQWGLYDMHGNIWEWCSDWWTHYPTEPQINPKGHPAGVLRVYRGGCWLLDDLHCRSAYRGAFDPNCREYDCVGFRLVSSNK